MTRTKEYLRTSRLACLALALILLICATLTSCSEPSDEPKETALLSPAMSILAESGGMAKAALVGENISFSADDFARVMNIESVSSVTITELPPISDGELRVGSSVITGEQTLSAASLSLMTFSSSEAVNSSQFKFKVNDLPYEMTCKLYSLKEKNYAPTLAYAPLTAVEVSTYEDVSCFGKLPCYDPDGDETRIEVVSYPEKGVLIIEDSAIGTYRYIPYENATGKDSFTYVAIDRFGNYSAAREVSLEIKRSEMSEKYVDLVGSQHQNSALAMTERGIMGGTQVGGALYFYPEREVSRAEFVVMAMNAAGITDIAKVSSTVFSDDAEIPSDMKRYIATAYELGYIKGSADENGRLCFEPSRSITRAEAAVMLGSMLGAATPTMKPVIADDGEIPTWAQSSVYAMVEMGVLDATETGVSPLEKLTRGSTADILARFIRYAEEK